MNSVGKDCKLLLQHSEFYIVLLHTNTCSKQYLIRGSNNNSKNRKYWTFKYILLQLERASIFHIFFRLFFHWNKAIIITFTIFILLSFPRYILPKILVFFFPWKFAQVARFMLMTLPFSVFFFKSLSASYLRFSMWAVNFQLYLPSLLVAIMNSKPLESWCKYTQSFLSCCGFRKAISATFKLAANPFNYSRSNRSNTVIVLCY